MMIFIFPLYNFCQVSKIRIPWCIERKRQLVPHHHFLLLPALKASPLNFFPAWFRGRCKCDYNLPIPDGFITHTHTKSFKKQQKETEAQKSKNKYNLMYLSFYHLWQFYKNQKNMDLISAISAKYKIESWCRHWSTESSYILIKHHSLKWGKEHRIKADFFLSWNHQSPCHKAAFLISLWLQVE